MARTEVEAQFVALWWRDAMAGKESALRIMGHIRSTMLEYQEMAEAYQYLVERYAKGKPLDDLEARADLVAKLGQQWFDVLVAERSKQDRIAEYVKEVLFNYRARRQASLLHDLAEKAAALVGTDDAGAAKLADHAIAKLSTLHTTKGDLNRPVTQQEITDRARLRLKNRGKSEGVPFPYQKLQDQMGNLIAGDVLAIAGYSNSGKSLVVANLFTHFAMAGVPVIGFPTEMGLAWHARAVAAHAKVPQLLAEREQWDGVDQSVIDAYDFALQELGRYPWEIVDKAAITPEEIIARASVIRRRWSGKTVVVMVDHMHRLDYGRGEADFEVGKATRLLRNWARQDEDGGIIFIPLYQPRKPADQIDLYRPVLGHQIRGVSEVWNEIDFLISPYRRWVKVDPNRKNPWGGSATAYTKDGFPEFTLPNKDGTKLDDEHVYVKIGKRRVGGEGPTVVLNIDAPSGHIYEVQRPKLAVVGGVAK